MAKAGAAAAFVKNTAQAATTKDVRFTLITPFLSKLKPMQIAHWECYFPLR